MNFDLGWFTTVPGMFITGGVVLLIIALIILIVTGKKSKKEKKEKEAADANVSMNANTAPDMNNGSVAVNPQQPMVDTLNTQSNGVDSMAQPVNMNGATPISPDAVAAAATPNNFMGQGTVNDPMMQNMAMPNVGTTTMPEVAPMPEVSASPVDMMQQPMGVNPMMQQVPTVSPVAPEPVQPVMPEVAPMPEVNAVPVDMMQQQMGANSMMQQVPTVSPVAPEPVQPVMPEVTAMPEVNTTPVDMMQQPMGVDPMMQQAPTVSPVVTPAPEISQPDVGNFSQPASQPDEHVIYGGVSPVVPDLNVNQESHQIYGGADPLANTQTIPTIASNEVQTEPVNEVPVIQQVAPVAPEVQAVPDIQVTPVTPVNGEVTNQMVTPVAPVAPVEGVSQVGPVQQ